MSNVAEHQILSDVAQLAFSELFTFVFKLLISSVSFSILCLVCLYYCGYAD